MKRLKLCDFGSASTVQECEITPYLVSRFYRAPEIMLGLEYNESVDMWSIGCVLYELYTGKILFSGKDNNEMLYQIQEIKGRFSNKLLNKAKFLDKHFDKDRVFELHKIDPITKQPLIEKVKFPKPTKDLKQILVAATPTAQQQSEHKRLMDFADLLLKMFELTPARRIKVDEALKHPFILDA
jgi:serine/threonine-protein kinase PRP4